MGRNGTSLAMGIGLLITAAVLVDAVFTGRKPWDIVLAVTRGESVPKASATPGTANAPVATGGGTSTKPDSGFLGGAIGSLKAQGAVTAAASMIGWDYTADASKRWQDGFADCSSLVAKAYKKVDITIGGNSYEQATNGANVPLDPNQVRAGDLIFYKGDNPRRNLGHVAIAISSTQQIAAPHTGTKVQIQPIRWAGAGPNSENGVQLIRRVA